MGFTALQWAADHGHEGIVRRLLGAGANPDAQDEEGLSSLHFACIKGNLECAKLMIPVSNIEMIDHKEEKTPWDHAMDSVYMASVGHDVDRGPNAQKIADILTLEPGSSGSSGSSGDPRRLDRPPLLPSHASNDCAGRVNARPSLDDDSK